MLKFLHLADSAFPIGATAHSLGLETLTSEGVITAPQLEALLHDHLDEAGLLEAACSRLAYQAAMQATPDQGITNWLALNLLLAALKPARENRAASATLGRRFLQMVATLENDCLLDLALRHSKQEGVDVHYCAAFGLAGGVLTLGEDATVLAYLQQMVTGLISACQRLLPLGQSQALQIGWQLKPVMAEVASKSHLLVTPAEHDGRQLLLDHLSSFNPMIEMASMRHTTLPTRLFIS